MKNGALRLQSFIVSLLFPKAEPKIEPLPQNYLFLTYLLYLC